MDAVIGSQELEIAWAMVFHSAYIFLVSLLLLERLHGLIADLK